MSIPRIAGWVGYPGAEQYKGKATGERVDKQGNHLPIRWIVIHGTNSPAPLQWWINHAATECAVTYMIGKDGRIAQFESDLSNQWGNGVVTAPKGSWWYNYPNEQSISIEHCKYAKNNNEPLTAAQAASSFALVAWLCRMYNIPMREADANGGIAPHSSVNPTYRWFCPGPYPWSDMYASIAAQQRYVPTGWVDSDGLLVPAA